MATPSKGIRERSAHINAEIKRLYAQDPRPSDEVIGSHVGLTVRQVRARRNRMRLLRRKGGTGGRGKLDWDYIQRNYHGRESIPGIARALKTSDHSVRRVLRDSLHLLENQTLAQPTPEQLAAADRMLDGTITYAEVARTVGLTRDQVAHHLPNRGMQQENMGAYIRGKQLAEELGI